MKTPFAVIWVVLTLILVPALFAEDGHLLTVSRVALYASAGADIATTLAKPQAEANPILLRSKPVAVSVVAVSVIALDLVTRKLSVHHPKLAATLNFIVAGEHGWAAQYNARVK